MTTTSTTYLTKLHHLLNQHFNLAEIEDLCFQLHIDYESVPGDEKPARIRALLLGLGRNGRLLELIILIQKLSPRVDWPPLPDDFELPESLSVCGTIVPTDQYHVYGDIVHGDKIGGDKVAGDKIVYQGLSTEEVADLAVKIKHKDQPKVWNGRNPYLGLTAFKESDAQFFFGRESLVNELLARVEAARFIVIAGPSGSGKSSVARAGLFHALREGRLERSDTWLLPTMQPKGNPIEQLALAIDRLAERPDAGDYLRHNGMGNPFALHEQMETLLTNDQQQRCVLLVDQFEELFTQTKNETERAAFINLLTAAAQVEMGRTTILVSLRSDFVSNCVRYAELRALMSQQFQLVGAMELPDLAKAITLPALEVGAKIDPELVSRIMADMKGEPGALPLMSFALRDLFEAEKTEQGKPMDLTLPEYLNRGGIESALERHATTVFSTFTDEQKILAQSVFSKLIEVGEGRVDTRRTVAFPDLIPAGTEPEAITVIVIALAKESVRLITIDAADANVEVTQEKLTHATVTIAHEKLIDAWPWLRQLVNDNREMIALQNQIHHDALAWADGQDSGYLYRAAKLSAVEEWQANKELPLNQLEQTFIEVSIEFRDKEIAEREAQRQRELDLERQRADAEARRAEEQSRSARRLRFWIVLLIISLIGSVIVARLALIARSEAQANELAVQAQNALSSHPQRSLLLALEANDLRRIPAAEEVLLQALANIDGRGIGKHNSVISDLALTSDNLLISAGDDGIVQLQPLLEEGETNPDTHSWTAHDTAITTLTLSPDNRWLVTASIAGEMKLWDLQHLGNMEPINTFTDQQGTIRTSAFDSTSHWLVTGNSVGAVRLWKAGETDLFGEYDILSENDTPIIATFFSPNGSWLITTDTDGPIHVWPVASLGDSERTPRLLEVSAVKITTVSTSPDGRWLIVGSEDNTVRLWDLFANDWQASLITLSAHNKPVTSLAMSSDSHWLATGSKDHTVQVWDMLQFQTNNLPVTTLPHEADVSHLMFLPDQPWLVSTDQLRTVYMWPLTDSGVVAEPIKLHGHEGAVSTLVTSQDGRYFVTGSSDSTIRLWDLVQIANPNEYRIFRGHTQGVTTIALSPDDRWLATGGKDAVVRVWDLADNSVTAVPHLITAHRNTITALQFNPDSQWLVTGSDDSKALLWQVNSLDTPPINLGAHEDFITHIVFTSDNQKLMTTGNNNEVRLWYLEPSGNIQQLTPIILDPTEGMSAFDPDQFGLTGPITSLSVSGNNRWLAVGCRNVTNMDSDFRDIQRCPSYLWDLDHLSRIILPGEKGGYVPLSSPLKDEISLTAFSPDDRWLVTTSDEIVYLWHMLDIDSNSIPIELEAHSKAITTISFTPDSQQLITGGEDRKIKFWDLNGDLQTPEIVLNHQAVLSQFTISNDGRWLIAIDEGALIYIYDLADILAPPIIFGDHDDTISGLTVSHSGDWFITGSSDTTVRLRSLANQQYANIPELACQIAGRNLTAFEWAQYLEQDYRKTCETITLNEPLSRARHWRLESIVESIFDNFLSIMGGIFILLIIITIFTWNK